MSQESLFVGSAEVRFDTSENIQKAEGVFQNLILNFIQKMFMPLVEKVINDSEALRSLLNDVVGTLKSLALRTAIVFDDMLVDALEYVLDNDDAWAFVYQKIIALWDHFQVDETSVLAIDPNAIREEAEQQGLDPAMLLIIINAALELFKWWRNRK